MGPNDSDVMASDAHQMAFVRHHSELCIDGCRDLIAEESIEFFCRRKPIVLMPA
jgi:hypothetical protein